MYNKIKNFPKQISNTIDNTKSLGIGSDYDKVVIVGMGGSAIAGLIIKDLLPQVNIVVERNYIPNTAINQNTLVIVSSYSGNTEETLSSYDDAINKGAQLFGVTTGGELCKRMKKDNVEFVLIPTGLQPRAALAYSLIPMLYLFHKVGFISKQVCNYLNNVITLLSKKRMEYRNKRIS